MTCAWGPYLLIFAIFLIDNIDITYCSYFLGSSTDIIVDEHDNPLLNY